MGLDNKPQYDIIVLQKERSEPMIKRYNYRVFNKNKSIDLPLSISSDDAYNIIAAKEGVVFTIVKVTFIKK